MLSWELFIVELYVNRSVTAVRFVTIIGRGRWVGWGVGGGGSSVPTDWTPWHDYYFSRCSWSNKLVSCFLNITTRPSNAKVWYEGDANLRSYLLSMTHTISCRKKAGGKPNWITRKSWKTELLLLSLSSSSLIALIYHNAILRSQADLDFLPSKVRTSSWDRLIRKLIKRLWCSPGPWLPFWGHCQ